MSKSIYNNVLQWKFHKESAIERCLVRKNGQPDAFSSFLTSLVTEVETLTIHVVVVFDTRIVHMITRYDDVNIFIGRFLPLLQSWKTRHSENPKACIA